MLAKKTPLIIPYVNIARQHLLIKSELMDAISYVIDSGDFVLGGHVELFEDQFAKLCDVEYAVAVNSGTDALIMALRVLDIGPGDEVVTVPNSFVASTSCIALVGARPVFVDVLDDFTMDPSQLEKVITPKTKAILPVHLTGYPADMKPIKDIADKYGIYIIEDCAQAVAAKYRDQFVGSLGNIGCFSLHPLKTLGACGDGGILTTNNKKVYDRLKLMRNLGLQTRDNCEFWSSNSRLDTIQAAILLKKLKYLNVWTERRRANAMFYKINLGEISNIKIPIEDAHRKAVYHTFVIQTEQRDRLQDYLKNNGIGTTIHYPIPIHLQSAAKELNYGHGSFPVAERQAQRILSLPIYPELEESDLEYIVSSIKAFFRKELERICE